MYAQYIIGRNFVKLTRYEKINTGRKRKSELPQTPSQHMSTDELEQAYQYRQRAKREKLLRLADANFVAGSCALVTLTFKENLKDYDTAIKAFKLFTKRMRRRLEDVRYIATIEIQQRGAYHFHMLVNAPDVQFALDNLTGLWDNGIIDIQAVDNVQKAVLYITKDLIKQNRSHPLFNKRCYFVSQGLTPCIEVNTWNGTKAQLEDVRQLLLGKSPSKSNQINSTNAGLVEYADYYFPTGAYPAPLIARQRRPI